MTDTFSFDSDEPVPAAEWSMQLGEEPGPEGRPVYHALLYRAGTYVSRIALAGSFPDRASAEAALKVQLQKWIDDYETRPHSGKTWFGPITK